ncbi:cupin domain-containing protein [Mucilaginibacter sp. SP1R1]|uniref:cupin domain-containing protein n=1 Tax=Mucilaginibacter sp. SP1R1 TaxID=2723091 RepID=UPI001609E9E9|nr:cupin domain-containing protein [Mucilaginibacter sp. SP1R1]MBB6148636.1 mannose-6-phosphate isomerase-like protein (cupin superfamily) [Mucilaginibacter sp. SP1R1]
MKTTETGHYNDVLKNEAVIFNPGQGEMLQIENSKITLKVTSEISNNQFGLYEIVLAPGTVGAQLHHHRFMDETFIVNKGTLTIQLSDKMLSAAEGTVVFVPKFTPHGFRNTSDAEVTLTLIFNPGQNREGFFFGLQEILTEQPVNPDKFLKLYHKYDSIPVDQDVMLPVNYKKASI